MASLITKTETGLKIHEGFICHRDKTTKSDVIVAFTFKHSKEIVQAKACTPKIAAKLKEYAEQEDYKYLILKL